MHRITVIKEMSAEELGEFLTNFTLEEVHNWFCSACPDKSVCDTIGKCGYTEDVMMYAWLYEDLDMPHCDICSHASPDDCKFCTYRKECEL